MCRCQPQLSSPGPISPDHPPRRNTPATLKKEQTPPMSKNLVRKGADRQPDKKGLGLTAWLALIGFALLGAAELTGNQASLQMKPAVNLLYGKGLTDVLSSVSSWTVAGALLLISLGLASRLTDMQAVAGFGIMSSIY